jgi:Fe-S-cluster containining protein
MLMDGDDPKKFDTITILHPEHGEVHVLRRMPNGDCVYLAEHGCSIHARAPKVCRAFDCRQFIAGMTSAHRRTLMRDKVMGEVVKAGKARLHTL